MSCTLFLHGTAGAGLGKDKTRGDGRTCLRNVMKKGIAPAGHKQGEAWGVSRHKRRQFRPVRRVFCMFFKEEAEPQVAARLPAGAKHFFKQSARQIAFALHAHEVGTESMRLPNPGSQVGAGSKPHSKENGR